MQQRTFIAIVLSVVLLAGAAALIGTTEPSDIRAARTGGSGPSNEPSTTSAKGFYIYYEKASGEQHQRYEQLLRKSGTLERVAHELNSYALPPKAVPIVFKECGESGAYYDVKTEDVTFCYEFLDEFNTVFTAERSTESAREQAVIGAAAFIVAHEAGHATIDLHGIPFTGKEEDVADQFATLILTRMDYGEAAVTGGEAFRLLGRRDGQYNLWSEHALDEQRYYNTVCWTRGADQGKYGKLTSDLPEKRQKSCAREFRNIESSWEKLLD